MIFVRFLSRILLQNKITLLGTNLFQHQTNLRRLYVLIFHKTCTTMYHNYVVVYNDDCTL